MNETNDGLSRPVGRCCAGQYCVNSSLELSNQYKYIACKCNVHMVCGEHGTDDAFTCFSCVKVRDTHPNDSQAQEDHEGKDEAQVPEDEEKDTHEAGESVPSNINKNKKAVSTTTTTGRKRTGKGPRIKVGCHVKTTRSKLFHVLTMAAQSECLPRDETNSRNYYGTVTKGNTSHGYFVRFDVLPRDENEVKLVRQKLKVVGDGEEEKPYNQAVSESGAVDKSKARICSIFSQVQHLSVGVIVVTGVLTDVIHFGMSFSRVSLPTTTDERFLLKQFCCCWVRACQVGVQRPPSLEACQTTHLNHASPFHWEQCSAMESTA